MEITQEQIKKIAEKANEAELKGKNYFTTFANEAYKLGSEAGYEAGFEEAYKLAYEAGYKAGFEAAEQ